MRAQRALLNRARWAIGLFLLCVLQPVVYACSCGRSPLSCPPPPDAPLVFIGSVLEKRLGDWRNADGTISSVVPSVVTFAVTEYLRGEGGAQVQIHTTEGCCACGYPFQVGVEYVVFAGEHKGRLATSICVPTQPVRTGAALVRQMRAAKQQQPSAQIFGFVGLAPEDHRMEARHETKPLADVAIQAMGRAGVFSTRTSADGVFEFRNLPLDKYRIVATLPQGMTTGASVFGGIEQIWDLAAPSFGCDASIRAVWDGRISGTIVDRQGRPIRRYVRVVPADEELEKLRGAPSSHLTNEDGRFRLLLLPPGRYLLVLLPDAAEPADRSTYYPGTLNRTEATIIELNPGEHVDNLRFIVPAQ